MPHFSAISVLSLVISSIFLTHSNLKGSGFLISVLKYVHHEYKCAHKYINTIDQTAHVPYTCAHRETDHMAHEYRVHMNTMLKYPLNKKYTWRYVWRE
jgi:hypothetical protein